MTTYAVNTHRSKHVRFCHFRGTSLATTAFFLFENSLFIPGTAVSHVIPNPFEDHCLLITTQATPVRSISVKILWARTHVVQHTVWVYFSLKFAHRFLLEGTSTGNVYPHFKLQQTSAEALATIAMCCCRKTTPNVSVSKMSSVASQLLRAGADPHVFSPIVRRWFSYYHQYREIVRR